MLIHKLATINDKGQLIDVYECEHCGTGVNAWRTLRLNEMLEHEESHVKEHHEEEASAGII